MWALRGYQPHALRDYPLRTNFVPIGENTENLLDGTDNRHRTRAA
ncbi:hypothetical protein AWB68_07398 [Caballeronia choica]|uniref:Uncharacterized protein n=1 Tax=Caballeronia choica TaxID=326476 RepID=A0A158KU25_9BURK|nr:hypothetical protein AWB68_07398 [Caballeronia choica]